jgi:signal transduction histidine kinase
LSEIRAHIGLLVLQAAALGSVFLITFRSAWGLSDPADQTPFYLMFLPIIWIALRWGAGVTAVALATVQIGIVAFVAKHNTPESFLAIQVLMVLLAGTGWFMGISESENSRINALMHSKDGELSGLNARMVRRLREFFRSGVVRRQLVDPRELAEEALAAMQIKLRAAGMAADLEIEVDLPPITADPLQLSMVLQNLLANAYDAVCDSAPRHGRIAVVVTRRANDVMFSVEDSGPGIPEQLRDQIFRPVTSTKSAGMGLGLAICRSLVEANEGRLWLVRSDASGTCIAFSIPFGMREANEVGA